jgi:hypothetical protein
VILLELSSRASFALSTALPTFGGAFNYSRPCLGQGMPDKKVDEVLADVAKRVKASKRKGAK